MANTPRYTFVQDSPLTPFFSGGITALGGIMQERKASEDHKLRLNSLADALAQQGLQADASIYRSFADAETPNYLASALSGKATARDLKEPFDHALDAIRYSENNKTALAVAGIRGNGTGTRMTLAEQNQFDEIADSEQRAAQGDADTAERDIAKIDNQITLASAAGLQNKVEQLQIDRAKAEGRRIEAINKRDQIIESRKKLATKTFIPDSNAPLPVTNDRSGSSAGGPANDATADLTGKVTAPPGSESTGAGQGLLPPFSGEDTSGQVVGPPSVKKFPTVEDAAAAGIAEAKNHGNPLVSTVKNDDNSFSFSLKSDPDIIASPINRESSTGKGNIDLNNRPRVQNPDGSVSTIRSISFNEDGVEVLVPTVSDDGKILSNQQAIDQYHKTGKFLGKFNNEADATQYAKSLSEQQGRKLNSSVAQREIDSRLSYEEQANKDLPDNASLAQRNAAIIFARSKDNAVRMYGKGPEIDGAKNPADLKAVMAMLAKRKTHPDESATPDITAEKGQEMLAALIKRGGDPKDYIVSMKVGPGGGTIPVIFKRSGLRPAGDSTWLSPDGLTTYFADKDGAMHERNNVTGEVTDMLDPNDQHVLISKDVFTGATKTLNDSPYRNNVPYDVNATDKGVNLKGQKRVPTDSNTVPPVSTNPAAGVKNQFDKLYPNPTK